MMNKKIITIEEKKVLTGRIADILRKKEYILFAYIFGSFASNRRFKDIDVGIFITDEAKMSLSDIKDNENNPPFPPFIKGGKGVLQLELEIEKELEDAINIQVDVRIVNRAPLSFIYNVLKSGFVIVDSNRSLRANFEGLVYKKYFDFQYLRREYLREIINAPV